MISVTGVKEIDKVLRELPKQMTHQILGAAHASAAKPLVERSKLLAPEGPTGNLVDSLGIIKPNVKKANRIGEIIVGPRRKGRYKGFAGHLVEYGTRKRRTKKGANRGVMKAKPFMMPAFNQTKGIVEKQIATEIGKVMVRTMRRYLK
jgi:HK97 gp10 family phage protein